MDVSEPNAWLGIVAAAVGGGFLGAIVTQFFEGMRANREREEARERERRERQLLALYELQDAMGNLATIFGVIGAPAHPIRGPAEFAPEEMIRSVQHVSALAVRVWDERIRELVQETSTLFVQALKITEQDRSKWITATGEAMGRLLSRIGEVLRDL